MNIESEPNIIHDKILELNPYHIITTNYDNLIERQANQKGMFYDIVSKDTINYARYSVKEVYEKCKLT